MARSGWKQAREHKAKKALALVVARALLRQIGQGQPSHRGRRKRRGGAGALRAGAVGALAIGALSTGAGAIGALAIGRLAIKRGRVGSLRIEELTVGRLRVDELTVVSRSENS
jgi:hypothetical protein